MDDAGDVIDDFAETYQVTRQTSGSIIDHRFQEGSSSTFSIEAALMPMKGRDIEALPEGDRTKESRKFYTTTLVQTKEEGENPREGDLILIDGKYFEARTSEPWPGFYKVVAVLRDVVARDSSDPLEEGTG